LLLAARKLTSRGTHHGVDTFFVFRHEVPSVGLLQRVNDLVISSVGLAEEDVSLDGRVEEDGLLADVADLLTEGPQVDFLDVGSIDQDLALVGVVESFDELNNGTLAGTRGAHDGSSFAELKLSGEVCKNFGVGTSGVEEIHALELNHTFNLGGAAAVFVLVNGRLAVDDVERQLSCNPASGNGLGVLAETTDREETRDDNEEDRDYVSSGVGSTVEPVVVAPLDEVATDPEGVAVQQVDAQENE